MKRLLVALCRSCNIGAARGRPPLRPGLTSWPKRSLIELATRGGCPAKTVPPPVVLHAHCASNKHREIPDATYGGTRNGAPKFFGNLKRVLCGTETRCFPF